MPPNTPTQKDIAEAARVSGSTVSRALRNDPTIPSETRDRIMRVARELGYRPNPFVNANMLNVRRPNRKHTKAILAYITPIPLKEYFAIVPQRELSYIGACKRADELGFQVDPVPIKENGVYLSSKRCTDILLARGVQGIIFAMFENPYVRFHLDWDRFAVATHDFRMVQPRFSEAGSNHYLNTQKILRNLNHLRYKRVGLAIPARADRYTQGAFSAAFCLYRDTQPKANQIARFTPSVLKDWNRENFLTWYKKVKPDAIIGISDDILYWLQGAGVSVPQDVGLASLAWEREKEPAGWSGIYQQHEMVGAAAVQLVVDQLMLNERGKPRYPKTILIDGEWISGRTLCMQGS